MADAAAVVKKKPAKVATSQESSLFGLATADAVAEFDAATQRPTGDAAASAPAPAVPTVESATAPQASPSPTSMESTALVFLDDPIARRLAVAWKTCGGNESTWFEMAGLQRAGDAQRMAKALRANGVCREGGLTDPLALQYIQAVIARPLKTARAKQKD